MNSFISNFFNFNGNTVEEESYVPLERVIINPVNDCNRTCDFISFCKEERPRIKKEFPDMKTREIIELIVSEWRILRDSEENLAYFIVLYLFNFHDE